MVMKTTCIHFLIFLGIFLLPLQAFSIDDISVNASIDSTSLQQGWPIKGTLEITHNMNQVVDPLSAILDGKPLKIDLARNVQISPPSPLSVSFYQFSLPAKNKGSYTLTPISIKVDGKTYKTFPVSYEVQGPISLPPSAMGTKEEATLKLEAFIDGPKELYPGQLTRLVYRYVYQGNIALAKEVLPMLEAKGLLKVGRNVIKNYSEGNSSIFEISQEVQAVESGDFSWGPSSIEGTVYVQDPLGNQQFTDVKLSSEAPLVKLTVKPFPLEGKPASFNGAFGQFTWDVKLLTPAKISVGDPINLDAAISGKTSNWDRVLMPELCCQPGFSGFFKQSDLPPVGQIQGDSKHFAVNMNPLSPAIKSIPSIQFSYFEPESGKYKILNSAPIPLEVAPTQDISLAQANPALDSKSFQMRESVAEWMHIYKESPRLNKEKLLTLKVTDLINLPLGSWWVLWIIPLSLVILVLQYILKEYLKTRAGVVKVKTSRDLYAEMLKTPKGSALFFQLLKESLLLRMFELGLIDSPELNPEELRQEGMEGEVRDFLRRLDSLRYTSSLPDKVVYEQALKEGQELFKKLRDAKHA